KLTKAQIKSGYAALKKIEGLIQSGKTSGDPLFKACDEFYTRVPHDFGKLMLVYNHYYYQE
uniref:PARP alpha-helical domain-containing protein n=1 Tax=Amphimedon queenslandica TaxID=400682 RepID=A0A1X7SNM2_AMPQE